MQNVGTFIIKCKQVKTTRIWFKLQSRFTYITTILTNINIDYMVGSIKMAILSITGAVLLVSGLSYFQGPTMDAVKKMECNFRECCHGKDSNNYIYFDSGCDQLLTTLNTKVYGQPQIAKPIYSALKIHLNDDKPQRPLVMYFTGWTGTGKTYVAKLIASHLYRKGMDSKFVKYISSSYHFPIKIEGTEQITTERNRLREMIRKTVSDCERSLIILDELDKLPSGVVDVIQPLVDYIDDVDGVVYNKAVFIFLSNTGSESLNNRTYSLYLSGKERKDIPMKDVEQLLIKESFNEQGGLRRSDLIQRHSIGLFVPFLPLERQHVKQCISDEIDALKINPDNRAKLIEDIENELSYFPADLQLYSVSGCKGVHEKVVNYLGYSELAIKFEKRSDL